MSFGKTLKLGKSLKENIDDAFEKFTTGGGSTGRNKKITIQKKDIDKKIAKQEQVKKAAENKTKKQTSKKVKKENVLSKNKQVDKAKQNRKAKQQKSTKSVDKKPSVNKLASDAKTKRDIKSNISDTKKKLDDLQVKDIKKKLNKKTTNNKKKSASSTKVPPTGAATAKNIFNKQKQSFIKRYKGPIAGAALVAGTTPYLMDIGNVSEGSISGGGNKDKKPLKKLKDVKVKTIKTKSLQQKKKDMPKVPTKKKSRSNIKGSSSYDAQFTYDQLKKRGLKPKGFMSPENFKKVKKLKEGTKDKTIGKPISPKDALKKKFAEATDMNFLMNTLGLKKPTRKRTMIEKIFGGGPDEAYTLKKGRAKIAAKNQARKDLKKQYPELMKRVTKKFEGSKVGLKDLPPKADNPGIHKLPKKVKMNMGFKPMFGGGFISSLYDKPEKIEKYKGNTTSARQVKGYGKAKKKA
jgi:histone H1/5